MPVFHKKNTLKPMTSASNLGNQKMKTNEKQSNQKNGNNKD